MQLKQCVSIADKIVVMTMRTKHYTNLSKLKSREERFDYLKREDSVGENKWGSRRHVNQNFYRSPKWRETRDSIIVRDDACDMGIEGHQINDMIIVHHIEPVTQEDLDNDSYKLYDPENLICVTDRTHRAIHYGSTLTEEVLIERKPNDTSPWKR